MLCFGHLCLSLVGQDMLPTPQEPPAPSTGGTMTRESRMILQAVQTLFISLPLFYQFYHSLPSLFQRLWILKVEWGLQVRLILFDFRSFVSYTMTVVTVNFIIPLAVMFYCYYNVSVTVKRYKASNCLDSINIDWSDQMDVTKVVPAVLFYFILF